MSAHSLYPPNSSAYFDTSGGVNADTRMFGPLGSTNHTRHMITMIYDNGTKEYNAERPHRSLGYQTPNEYAKACTQRYGATRPEVVP